MKRPSINSKTLKVIGATLLAFVIVLAVIFAVPLLGGGSTGKVSSGGPTIGGEFGKLPSGAYGIAQ